MDVKIETRFNNGSISFRIGNKLVKLTAGTLGDLKELIKPNAPVRQGAMDIFTRYWRGSVELVRGPNGEQLEQWNSEPRWKHQPYVSLSELCGILGILYGKDLSAFAAFAKDIDFRICRAYIDWNLSHQEGGFYNQDTHSKESTVVVDKETWERMKEQMASGS